MQQGITDKECRSLQKDTGLNPDLAIIHKNCEDLHDLLDCFLRRLQDKLPAYDVCHWKDYLREVTANIYQIQKALICSDCGQWQKIHEIEYSLNQLWAKMAKVEADLDAIASQKWEVQTRTIAGTPLTGLTMTLTETGSFCIDWTVWETVGTTILGKGKLIGQINLGMTQEEGIHAKWQIRSVTLQSIDYKVQKASTNQAMSQLIIFNTNTALPNYEKQYERTSSFSEAINQTIPINLSGRLDSGSTTGWLSIFTFKQQGPSQSGTVEAQMHLLNHSLHSVPPYI